MSHFIIRSSSAIIFGTPNGQASTQLEQAMQRGLRAVMTRPSAERLMASAGQTSAQVGDSQCMHTTGTVCGDCPRSTYSRWIIECPLCVSHSEQAWTQAWQPMQRLGSTKNSISALIMTSLLRLQPAGVLGLGRLLQAHGADLVLGDVRDRILGGDRHQVDAPGP